jgi:hypothetical protein
MLLIVGLVVLANLPYLVGVFDINQLGPRSGLVSAFALGPLGGQPDIDPNAGFVSQALGHAAALDLLHLHLPWWNPYEGTGTALAGELQSAALFPPTLLLALSNGQLYEHLLLEIVAGLSTFVLLRRIGIGRWASTAGGGMFALNGTFAWFAHAPVNPIAFLPLLLLGIEHAYSATGEGRRGGWWLIGVAGALSFYGGFPETAYIDTCLAVFWWAWRFGCLEREQRSGFAVKAAAGALAGVLLAAPLLIAGLDFSSHAFLGAHATDFYGSAHIPPRGLPQLLFPYIYGPILDYAGPGFKLLGIWVVVGGYLSAALLMLAGLGLFARGWRGLRIVLGVWTLLVFARMYGQVPLLGHVLGWLPGMGRIAFFRYATVALEFPVMVLAAIGVHDIATVPEHRRRLLGAGAFMLVLVGLAALGARPLASQLGAKYNGRPYFALAVGWGALTVIALALSGRWRERRLREPLMAAVLIVDALAMFVVPEASAPRSVTVDRGPPAYLAKHLGPQRFFTLGPLQPNYGSYYKVSELNVNDVPIPSLFATYISRQLDHYVYPTRFVGTIQGSRPVFAPAPLVELEHNLAGYRAAGVSYVLTSHGQTLPQSPSRFTLAAQTPSTNIYRLAGAAPFYTAPGCTTSHATIESVTVTCSSATRLVRRETYMPGWSASVSGSDTQITEVDRTFQRVNVPAGTHTVSFGFSPPFIIWGWLAFAVALVMLPFGSTRARAQLDAAIRR